VGAIAEGMLTGRECAPAAGMKDKPPTKSQPPPQDPQGGRPGKKAPHTGGAGAQSGSTGHQGKRSPK